MSWILSNIKKFIPNFIQNWWNDNEIYVDAEEGIPEDIPKPTSQQDEEEDVYVDAEEGIPETDSQLDDEITFEEQDTYDPSREHPNKKLLSKWMATIPESPNVDRIYFPGLIEVAREELTRVLTEELNRKGQIKAGIIAECLYTRNQGTTNEPIISRYTSWH